MKQLSGFKIIIYFGILSAIFCSINNDLIAQEGNISPKELPPGVMTTIEPDINFSETFQWSDIPSLVGEDGGNDWARDLFFNKEIWCLEFSFKPIRMMSVDFPGENGQMEPKNVWYLVYSVTNTGKVLGTEIEYSAENQNNEILKNEKNKYEVDLYLERKNNLKGTYKPKPIDYSNAQPDQNGIVPGSVRFVPQFVLASNNNDDPLIYEKQLSGFFSGQSKGAIDKTDQIYFDEFLPIAFLKISAFESKNQDFDFKHSVEIPTMNVLPGHTVWGIATWVEVDPKIDRFSVYISGLSNSLRWQNTSDINNVVDLEDSSFDSQNRLQDRDIQRRVLKLNFYRPGDEFDENTEEFFFGAPGELDYKWIYL